jgi:sigma-B regulation protein RsbU (phosphoserine phosphatase)
MMAFSLLRLAGNKLQYSSAGMPPMYIYRNSSKTVEEINMKGMPLGAIKDFDYQLYETEFRSGDCILLLSDGYPELLNDNNEQIGYDRVKTQFASISNREPDEILNYFKDYGIEWVKDKEPDDDVTFVVIKVK